MYQTYFKMLLASQLPEDKSPLSLAFAATLHAFKISIAEISRLSGVPDKKIAEFRDGVMNITMARVSKIIMALTPTQSSFYAAMVTLQAAAKAAEIEIPPIDFRTIDDVADIYSQAYKTMSEWCKDSEFRQSRLSAKSKLSEPHISRWRNGKYDMEQGSVERLIQAMQPKHRLFYLALVDIFFVVGCEKATQRRERLKKDEAKDDKKRTD